MAAMLKSVTEVCPCVTRVALRDPFKIERDSSLSRYSSYGPFKVLYCYFHGFVFQCLSTLVLSLFELRNSASEFFDWTNSFRMIRYSCPGFDRSSSTSGTMLQCPIGLNPKCTFNLTPVSYRIGIRAPSPETSEMFIINYPWALRYSIAKIISTFVDPTNFHFRILLSPSVDVLVISPLGFILNLFNLWVFRSSRELWYWIDNFLNFTSMFAKWK